MAQVTVDATVFTPENNTTPDIDTWTTGNDLTANANELTLVFVYFDIARNDADNQDWEGNDPTLTDEFGEFTWTIFGQTNYDFTTYGIRMTCFVGVAPASPTPGTLTITAPTGYDWGNIGVAAVCCPNADTGNGGQDAIGAHVANVTKSYSDPETVTFSGGQTTNSALICCAAKTGGITTLTPDGDWTEKWDNGLSGSFAFAGQAREAADTTCEVNFDTTSGSFTALGVEVLAAAGGPTGVVVTALGDIQ